MVEDGHRWFELQGKLISAIRAGAPQHTIIASGHRWSGLAELLFMQPYGDGNVILRHGLVALITKDVNEADSHLHRSDRGDGNYPERADDWRRYF